MKLGDLDVDLLIASLTAGASSLAEHGEKESNARALQSAGVLYALRGALTATLEAQRKRERSFDPLNEYPEHGRGPDEP